MGMDATKRARLEAAGFQVGAVTEFLGLTPEESAFVEMKPEKPPMNEEEDRLGMTPEQWETFQAYTRGYGEQDENGVDISLLRANLKLTPTERIEKMRRALAFVMEVRRAGEAAGLSPRSCRA